MHYNLVTCRFITITVLLFHKQQAFSDAALHSLIKMLRFNDLTTDRFYARPFFVRLSFRSIRYSRFSLINHSFPFSKYKKKKKKILSNIKGGPQRVNLTTTYKI